MNTRSSEVGDSGRQRRGIIERRDGQHLADPRHLEGLYVLPAEPGIHELECRPGTPTSISSVGLVPERILLGQILRQVHQGRVRRSGSRSTSAVISITAVNGTRASVILVM